MRTLTTALLAGVLAGGCATFTGSVDDKGRAYRETNEAPVAANLEPLAADPTIRIFNDRLPTRGGRDQARAGGEPPSACEAERWQHLLGVPQSDVEAEDLPDSARIVEWGEVVTQDYEPSRLNVQLDQRGRVYRVICG